MLNDIQIQSGVNGGTLSTALNIDFQDLLFTAIMALIGADNYRTEICESYNFLFK